MRDIWNCATNSRLAILGERSQLLANWGEYMISKEDLTMFIQQSMADAKVSIVDRTGTMDHFNVDVVSDMFKGKNLLDRHRMIYQALDVPMKDGRIHAVELQAKTHDEA
ncbi:BolA family protein [Candidatus Nitrospira salsa]|nr:MAG: hypothetical protein NPIRA01_24020 [Nitrospirales bacterium]